jgi:hypothetical protein
MADSRDDAGGVRLPVSHCPNCDKVLDAATAIERGARPKPGDITICLDCGHLMAFGDDLRVRPLTDAEMVEVAGDPRIVAAQAVTAAWRKRKSQ